MQNNANELCLLPKPIMQYDQYVCRWGGEGGGLLLPALFKATRAQ